MNKFMTKSIFLTSVLLIFAGLSVSAVERSFNYDFGSSYQVLLPSEKTAIDAGIFSQDENPFNPSDEIGGPQRGWGDPDPLDPPGGGTENPDCSFNDCPVGNGMYILISLLAAYGVILFYRRKRSCA